MTKIDLDIVLQAIDDEEEFSDPMPDNIWKMFKKKNREEMAEALRLTIRLTKKGIRERIQSKAQVINPLISDMDLQYYFIDIGGVVTKRTEGFTEEDPEWGDIQGIVLYLTPSHVFEKEHRHADWTDNAVYDELEKGGFHAGELIEGILEFDLDTDIDVLKNFLSDHPKFEENEEFGTFIRSFAWKN